MRYFTSLLALFVIFYTPILFAQTIDGTDTTKVIADSDNGVQIVSSINEAGGVHLSFKGGDVSDASDIHVCVVRLEGTCSSALTTCGGVMIGKDDVGELFSPRLDGWSGQLCGIMDLAESLAADTITTGDFASDANWTKGAGWTITGGVGRSTDSAAVLSQAATCVENAQYQIVYDVAAYTDGTITVSVCGTAGTARSSAATFTENIIAGSGSLIEFTTATAATLDIDNVTMKEVDHVVLQVNSW